MVERNQTVEIIIILIWFFTDNIAELNAIYMNYIFFLLMSHPPYEAFMQGIMVVVFIMHMTSLHTTNMIPWVRISQREWGTIVL